MPEGKTFRRSCASNLIGLLLFMAMVGAVFMFVRSVQELRPAALPPTATPLPTPTLRPTNTPTPLPSPTITPVPPTATPVDPNDTGWVEVRSGLEARQQAIISLEDGRVLERVTIMRLDPNQFNFDIGYSPGSPKTLESWRRDSGAILTVNAGYFTADYLATGLTIVQGQPTGSSYGPFAGMVTIGGAEPSANIDVRWLRQAPYNPAEQLWAGFQSFPMLVHSGGVAAFPPSSDNGDRSQRTVIGKTTDGRIILLATTRAWFTLSEISSWLAQSDLNLELAINLDGGTSTGLILDHPNQSLAILPFSPLPTVLLVYEN
ncbi:MAG: phosphodiester glycosidase family protein [Chloroflexota bacterium]